MVCNKMTHYVNGHPVTFSLLYNFAELSIDHLPRKKLSMSNNDKKDNKYDDEMFLRN